MFGHEARLEGGVATVDITPSEPVVMGGYGGRDGRFTRVHDPLLASALVLDDGAVRVGIVAVDLLNVSRELAARVRRRLATSHGLDEVVIAASHTHAGPYMPARAFDISPALMADEDVSSSVAEIEAGITAALEDAASDRVDVTIHLGRSTVEGVAENRRARGGVSGNIRIPFGEVDSELTAAHVEFADGRDAIVYNFACHPVCGPGSNTELSADWPGPTRTRVREEWDGAHVLFLNGAAGDINPGTTAGNSRDRDPFEFMADVGGRIGDGVVQALDPSGDSVDTITTAPIRMNRRETTFPLKRTPAPGDLRELVDGLEDELQALRDTGDDRGAKAVRFRLQQAKETLAVAEWDATTLPSRLTSVEIGNLAFLGMPGEVHVAHGFAFKERAGVDVLMPVGYADDYVGYIPTLDDLTRLGYEVRTMKLAPDAIVEFRETAGDLLAVPGDR